VKKSLRTDHLYVRRALAAVRDEERALRAKLHSDAVLHRAGRKI
jgi:hypothetical protein